MAVRLAFFAALLVLACGKPLVPCAPAYFLCPCGDTLRPVRVEKTGATVVIAESLYTIKEPWVFYRCNVCGARYAEPSVMALPSKSLEGQTLRIPVAPRKGKNLWQYR